MDLDETEPVHWTVLDQAPEEWCRPCEPGIGDMPEEMENEQEALDFLGPLDEEPRFDYDEEEAKEYLAWCTEAFCDQEDMLLGHPTHVEAPEMVGATASSIGPTFGPQPGLYPPGFMGSDDAGIGAKAPGTPTKEQGWDMDERYAKKLTDA